ncbi:MAG TPA: MgtC/SapB family protein [Prosthecochloris aestuarii]|uniref:MgtC/SapB family protein n=1 Tax=Prosthecochloris aestuarii TaxID=1102 RepID=A0A831WVR2_PROAE|nr:MgtC/SapB family protein [Prosthecochloris aestuarii]
MTDIGLWKILGVALGLGLLVGLQREWSKSEGAGIRTYPLITVAGTVSGLLAHEFGGIVLFGGIIVAGALMVMMKVMMNIHLAPSEQPHTGPTTGFAAVLMYLVGAMLALDMVAPAIAVGGGVALLLQWKQPLHGFVKRIGTSDIQAVFRLVLIAMVVLPILPDRTYGPYDVLNPFHIWLMVVFIVGISVTGYMVSRFFGARAGSLLGGILGGLISSTATTISYARRSATAPDTAPLAAMVIMIASTIVFVRVTFEVAVVAPAVLPHVVPQFGVMGLYMAVIAFGAYFFARNSKVDVPEAEDPSDLTAAVMFGALYAFVLVAVAAAREHFGDQGLYIVAAISGLTDMDAITLSTVRLIEDGRLPVETGWRMMLIGALSNIVFKGGVVAVIGHPRLWKRVLLLFGLSIAGGIVLLMFWPG